MKILYAAAICTSEYFIKHRKFRHLAYMYFESFHLCCHARMREKLSYLDIPETTSVFCLYEATIVDNILMQVLKPENA